MRTALLALSALGVALAATLAVELATPGPGDDDAAASTGIRAAPRLPRLDSARASAQVIDHTDAWVATILARPLFSRDRRPSDAKVASGSGGGAGLPRLTGIAVSPDGRSAIFAGGSGGKALVLGEGGSVGGYTIKAIAPGAVQVIGPGGARTLAPVFDPAPPVPSSAAPGQNPNPGIPGLRFTPGVPALPGRPFVPGRPRFGDGASIGPEGAPNRFDAQILDADASQ